MEYANFGGGALKSVWKVFSIERAVPIPNISAAVERLAREGKCQEDLFLLVALVLEQSPDVFNIGAQMVMPELAS